MTPPSQQTINLPAYKGDEFYEKLIKSSNFLFNPNHPFKKYNVFDCWQSNLILFISAALFGLYIISTIPIGDEITTSNILHPVFSGLMGFFLIFLSGYFLTFVYVIFNLFLLKKVIGDAVQTIKDNSQVREQTTKHLIEWAETIEARRVHHQSHPYLQDIDNLITDIRDLAKYLNEDTTLSSNQKIEQIVLPPDEAGSFHGRISDINKTMGYYKMA